MKTKILLTVFLSLATVCYGRLGETEAECARRYGAPDDPNDKVVGNYKANIYRPKDKGQGVLLITNFLNGRAACIRFERVGGGKIANDEIDLLLNANSQGHKWQLLGYESPGVSWVRDDGAGARYRQDFAEILVIETHEHILFEKAQRNPKVRGF